LRLTIPSEDDKTRSRWPIHPLWALLSSVDWEAHGGPLSKRFTAARSPNDDKLFQMACSVILADMPRTFDALDATYTKDQWETLAKQVGSAPSRIVTSVMADLMNGMHVGGKLGELNEAFFKYNFMDQWNRSMHIESTKHAVEFLREHSENSRGNTGATGKDGTLRSRRFLQELGLTDADVVFNKAGEPVLNDKTERAIVQYVEEAMAHPDAGSNPMWMNDQRFALLSQMKRFTFAHAKYILDRGIKEVKDGNIFPLLPVMIAMPWMMAADGMKNTLRGSEGYQAKDMLDLITHSAERAGLAGRGQFGVDAAEAAGRGGNAVEALGGPSVEMFGNISRAAHDGKALDAMLDYIPGSALVRD